MDLTNKLGITDPVQLAHEEERISKRAALTLYREHVLDELYPVSFATLRAIHTYLFGDILADMSRIDFQQLSMVQSRVRAFIA